jgi:hypothetical protein
VKNKPNIKQVVLSTVAVLVFGIYLSADILNNLHGHFVHKKQAEVICTQELEENSCHRTVFHQDKASGCEHGTHFLPSELNCEICALVLHRHVLAKSEVSTQSFSWEIPFIQFSNPNRIDTTFVVSYLLRGPPPVS